MAHGHAAVKPGYDFFYDRFCKSDGKNYNIKKAFLAASVFNVLTLKDMPIETATILIDYLAFFGFPEFTPLFLQGMKDELIEVQRQANLPFDWDTVPGAKEYSARLA